MSSDRRKSNRGTAKPMPIRTKKALSNYQKRQMLIMLKESNCHPTELKAMSARFKVDENNIKDFLNEQAELAQTRIGQSFQSQYNKHFTNLDECARNLLKHNECASDNTLPVTLEAIANIEKHPPPEETNDINLKVLYQLLANMTAGYPIDDLENGPTKDFLKQCFSELIDDVPEMDVKSLQNLLIEQDKQTQPVYSWLCNSDYSQYLLKFFNDIPNE